MDEKQEIAREHFFDAILALAASASSIQVRLAKALICIVPVPIETFDGHPELKLRYARILDLVAKDKDDLVEIGMENATHMSDGAAITVAALICDFYDDLAS
jgi:hypothetical protein